MKNGDFTKRKFLTFSLAHQHKKCAELLRIAYDQALAGNSTDAIDSYLDLIKWMSYPSFDAIDRKQIADRYHQHASFACLHHKEHHLLTPIRQGDKLNAEISWNLSIYLDNIRSAHNVGSILRTVEAFSMGQVHFSESTPFSSHKQVKDCAMGTEKWIHCFQNGCLKILPKPLIVMETSDSAISLFDYLFPEVFTLVVGNEEYGCSENSIQQADIILEIPLRGRKNSLNVANAFAIVAAEIARQKTLHARKIVKNFCC